MYVRTIKITFKDKMSKDMFVNYTDTKADAEGIKNGTLMKFVFSNSDVIVTLVLIFLTIKLIQKTITIQRDQLLIHLKSRVLRLI